jgi:hypothetical protein
VKLSCAERPFSELSKTMPAASARLTRAVVADR